MCSKCFDTEIEKFDSGNDFILFEMELEQKLKQNDGLFFLRQSSATELLKYSIYGCKTCNSKWYLNIPNSIDLGFFLFEVNAKLLLYELKASDTKKRTVTIVICLIIMIICLYVLADMI